MRVLRKTCLIGIGAVALAATIGLAWLFGSDGLPDSNAIARFAPESVAQVSDHCLKTASAAIPYDAIGNNMRSALSAAEAKEDDPGVLSEMLQGFWHPGPHRVTLSLQISRTMFCDPDRTLNRQLHELRAAVQLERRFSRRELFTIFANRVTFGKDIVGVEAASQHFLRKEPNQLLVGEAALLAALVKAPSYYSPIDHPDRALRRRNEVVDAMVGARAISESEGSTAKASPLKIN